MVDTPLFQDVLEAISRGEKVTNDELESALTAHAAISKDLARWQLARWVIWVYAFVVVGAALSIFTFGVWNNENVADQFFELIKIAVIPIMTFVLGFYYGTSKKS